jgi:hypothetical protein
MVTRSQRFILALMGTGAILLIAGLALAGEDEARARWEETYN